uniref:Uncharacterized protein n=2 Tax=Picea TaxID=3328 RepID=A0A124GN59_PICGL|nr:hypothetical protein ABT39_MTgene4792 [Picea glauca]QHR91682.1 hypothetical protein Q903MT_gene5718 [Picea sitchensis]
MNPLVSLHSSTSQLMETGTMSSKDLVRQHQSSGMEIGSRLLAIKKQAANIERELHAWPT